MQGHPLGKLFKPGSLVLYGASDTAGSLGQVLLHNIESGGFRGPLVLVNPRHGTVGGRPCHATLADSGQTADLAVIAAPARAVPAIIDDCGAQGVAAAIVLSAGFREAGVDGARLEAEMLARARRHRIRVLGPNCLGIVRADIGLNATFSAGNALPGRIAVISQSGALCTAILDWAQVNEVGFSSLVSTGIAADVGFGEILDFVATDPATDSIMMYVEGLHDARRFLSALRAAARTKPVVVMKSGRHAQASRAAVSHTGALVGSDGVFDAAIRRAGALRVYDFAEFFSTAATLDSGMRARGSRLAVVTNAGGPGVMAADHCADAGLTLAELSADTLAALDRSLPSAWSRNNPVDILGDAGPDRFEAAIRACIEAGEVDAVLAVLTPQAQTAPLEVARRVVDLRTVTDKPLMACWMGEASVREALELFQEANFPAYRSPEAAIRAFAAMAAWYDNQQQLLQVPAPLGEQSAPDVAAARAVIGDALNDGRELLDPIEARRVLGAFGIPVLPGARADSAGEAMRVADALGYPVVMKIDSPDIVHKTEVDGVRLGLEDRQAVAATFDALVAGVAAKRPGASIRGVVLEPQWRGRAGRELMIGLFRDEVFGPAISFGLGGTLVEVVGDSVIGLPPLNAALASRMVARSRAARTLGSWRGADPVPPGTLQDLLLRVSELACELPAIVEMDLNPVLADERGAVVVDPRIVVSASPVPERAYDHLAIHPWPRDLVQSVVLADGSEVTLRPIRPEDARMEQSFVNGLSDESRFFRFMASMREISPGQLARFTQIDYDRDMALVATVMGGQGEQQVGVARYASLSEPGECEFAIVVADDWQGRGLARALLRALIDIARERRFLRMHGIVLKQNQHMIDFSRSMGFRVEQDAGDPDVVRVVLELS